MKKVSTIIIIYNTLQGCSFLFLTEAGPPKLHLDKQYSIAVALLWSPPDSPGNITGYWITYFGNNTNSSTFVKAAADGTIQRATIGGLTPDTNYTFIVYAVNSKGVGQASLSLLIATLNGSIGKLIKILFRNLCLEYCFGIAPPTTQPPTSQPSSPYILSPKATLTPVRVSTDDSPTTVIASESSGGLPGWVIAVIATGAATVLLLLLVVCCCYYKRTHRKG